MDHFVGSRKIEVLEKCKSEREELDKCIEQNIDCKDMLEKYNKCRYP